MAGDTKSEGLASKALKKLEDYLQLDLRYYIKNFSFLTFAQFVALVSGLLISIPFARLLPQEVFGQYNYVLSILGVLAIFSLPGMDVAIGQAVARGHDRVLVEGTKEIFKWSILGTVVTLGVGVYYFLSGSILLGKCFMISSLLFPFFENFRVYAAFLQGKKLFGRMAKYRVINQIFFVLPTFLAVYFTRDLIIILVANLVSNSLLKGYFFRATLKSVENRSSDEKAITFGKRLSLMEVVGMIAGQADRIIAGILLGFSNLAVYSIALVLFNGMKTMMSPLSGITFPKLAVMSETEAYSAVKKRYLYLVLVAAVASGIMILVCPYLLPFLYSQKYVASILYAQILLASLIFDVPTQMLSKALFPSQREVTKLYKFRIVYPVVQIILIVALTPSFGLLGIALAVLLANVFGMAYSLKLAKWI